METITALPCEGHYSGLTRYLRGLWGYFSPSSGTVRIVFLLLEAIKPNFVQSGKVKVKDSASVTKELSVAEAIHKGIVSKERGDYNYSGGWSISLVDALHVGVIIVCDLSAIEPETVSWEDA